MFGKVRELKATTSIDWEHMRLFGNVEGMNSAVYLATDKQLGQEFLVKKISKKALREENINDFFEESKILYEVSHPHIAEIQYASYDKEFIYLVMPYYKNGSLSALMNKRELSMEEIVKYSLEFLSGLLYIHSRGIVHLDIKPTNILINHNGKAVLTDFGLAKYLNEETGLTKSEMMYFVHSVPEYFDSNVVGVAADIYQAGLTMYRMVIGEDEWASQVRRNLKMTELFGDVAMMRAVKGMTFPDRNKFPLHTPAKLRKIICKCLKPNIEDRYANVLDLMNDLAKVNCTKGWKHEYLTSGERWTLSEETKETRIELSRGYRGIDMVTTRLYKNSKTERRVRDMCQEGLSFAQCRKLIEEYTS